MKAAFSLTESKRIHLLKTQQNTINATMGRGLMWSLPRVIVGFVVSIVRSIVLARLLEPEDFGTAGIALAFMQSVSWAGTFGLTAAILQTKELSRDTINSAYWAVFSIYGIAGCALGGITPLIANAYGNERITPLLYVCACTVAVQGAQAVPFTLLHRSLKFGAANSILLIVQVVTLLVGTLMAVNGGGAASLVVPDLVALIIATFVTHCAAKFIPSLRLDLNSIRPIVSYAARSQAFEMLTMAYPAIVGICLSYVLRSAEYGLVFFAISRAERCFQPFISMVRTALFTALCAQTHKAAAWREFLDGQGRIIFYAFVLVSYALVLFADQIVPWTFGEQWIDAVAAFRLACLASLTITATGFGTPYFRSVGSFRILFFASAVRVVAFFSTLVLACLLNAGPETTFASVFWGNLGFLVAIAVGGIKERLIACIASLRMFLQVLAALAISSVFYFSLPLEPTTWLELAVAAGISVGIAMCVLFLMDRQLRTRLAALLSIIRDP